MADEKKLGRTQSFSKLLRESAGAANPPPKEGGGSHPIILQSDKGAEERERKNFFSLPFFKGAGKDASLLKIGYKEWTFLLGAILTFFGGLAVVRYMSPKEGPVTPSFEVAPTDFEDGSRPPTEGEPTDDVISSAQGLRDTTRLVQSGLPKPTEPAKDAKGPADPLKDSFWNGLRKADEGVGKAPVPRLPGMFGALNALLGGGGGGGMPPIRTMSPEEISGRIKAISPSPSDGGQGLRLGYSGAQSVPGAARNRRFKYSSSGDQFGKMRQEARDKLNSLNSGAEQLAAQAANKFGEGTDGGPAAGGGGASTGGETPGIQKSEADNVDYKLGRDLIADEWAKWELERHKKIWDATWGEIIKTTMKYAMGGCNADYPARHVDGGLATDVLAAAPYNCNVGNFSEITGVSDPRLVIDEGRRWCQMELAGSFTQSTTGGDKETETKIPQTGNCRVEARDGNDSKAACGHIKVTTDLVRGGCTQFSGLLRTASSGLGSLGKLAGSAVRGVAGVGRKPPSSQTSGPTDSGSNIGVP